MAEAEDWSKILQDHPIFSPPHQNRPNLLELSTLSLRDSENVDSSDAGSSTFGRRQTMILKDSDLIVAAGQEIRMSSFGDIKLSTSTRKSYKVACPTVFLSFKTHDLSQTLHTPNLQFEIRQISLNPSGKLLAVAGTHQVAVIVLPRAGYSRLVPEAIDCKYALPLLSRLFFLPLISLDVFKSVNSTMQQTLQRQFQKLTGIHGEKLVQPYL
jgi:nucleoporin NUP82